MFASLAQDLNPEPFLAQVGILKDTWRNFPFLDECVCCTYIGLSILDWMEKTKNLTAHCVGDFLEGRLKGFSFSAKGHSLFPNYDNPHCSGTCDVFCWRIWKFYFPDGNKHCKRIWMYFCTNVGVCRTTRFFLFTPRLCLVFRYTTRCVLNFISESYLVNSTMYIQGSKLLCLGRFNSDSLGHGSGIFFCMY